MERRSRAQEDKINPMFISNRLGNDELFRSARSTKSNDSEKKYCKKKRRERKTV